MRERHADRNQQEGHQQPGAQVSRRGGTGTLLRRGRVVPRRRDPDGAGDPGSGAGGRARGHHRGGRGRGARGALPRPTWCPRRDRRNYRGRNRLAQKTASGHRGLLLPGERKSIEPLAARVAPGHDQELRHFVSESDWDDAVIGSVLLDKADRMVGGPDSVLIIDDTALPKKGDESVGVAHQYCGALGKQANCQSLVTLTLAKDDVPVPLSLPLYLPGSWASDPKRRKKAGVPAEIVFREKWRIALDEVKRLKSEGVRFGTVLADAGYGVCGELRNELSSLGLLWAVGVLPNQRAYPAHATARMPRPSPRGGMPRAHAVASHLDRKAVDIIEDLGSRAFRSVTWRNGTKGPLRARFAACRVRLTDGPKGSHGKGLPGAEVWLVCE